jgi:hypothetical protein
MGALCSTASDAGECHERDGHGKSATANVGIAPRVEVDIDVLHSATTNANDLDGWALEATAGIDEAVAASTAHMHASHPLIDNEEASLVDHGSHSLASLSAPESPTLLALPQEIRDQIYTEVFQAGTKPFYLVRNMHDVGTFDEGARSEAYTTLRVTCRQIDAEIAASKTFWSQTLFVLDGREYHERMLRCRRPTEWAYRQMRRILLCYSYDERLIRCFLTVVEATDQTNGNSKATLPHIKVDVWESRDGRRIPHNAWHCDKSLSHRADRSYGMLWKDLSGDLERVNRRVHADGVLTRQGVEELSDSIEVRCRGAGRR